MHHYEIILKENVSSSRSARHLGGLDKMVLPLARTLPLPLISMEI